MALRFYDSAQTSIYRVVCRNSLDSGLVQLDTWNVKASSPTAAREWVLTHKATGRYSEIVTAYKVRRQPVWLRKVGTWGYRFDLRKREVFRPIAI